MLLTNSRDSGAGEKKKNNLFLPGISLGNRSRALRSPSLALSPSSDLEHEEQSGAPFSQLLIKKQTFLKPPDTAPTYFLPPHPPDTHSREGVQLPCVHFFYILFIDRPLAWLKSKAENICPILPFGKCQPGETRRCHTALGNMPGG